MRKLSRVETKSEEYNFFWRPTIGQPVHSTLQNFRNFSTRSPINHILQVRFSATPCRRWIVFHLPLVSLDSVHPEVSVVETVTGFCIEYCDRITIRTYI